MNVTSRLKSASYLLATLIIPTLCYADAYKPSFLSDIQTVEQESGDIQLSDRSVEFTLSYQASDRGVDKSLYVHHSPQHVKYIMKDSWTVLKQFLRAKDIPYRDCRENYNIHIFVVDRSVLYDRGRFSDYFVESGIKSTVLWGYYDSTLEIEKNSVLLVANINSDINDALLAHEMSHYWWDRMCIARYWPSDTEDFADAFQEYYEAQR